MCQEPEASALKAQAASLIACRVPDAGSVLLCRAALRVASRPAELAIYLDCLFSHPKGELWGKPADTPGWQWELVMYPTHQQQYLHVSFSYSICHFIDIK